MRKALPNRRPCETITVYDAAGKPMDVSVGYDSTGHVREIFADGHKIGSDAEADIDDALVMVSIALQTGWPVAKLAKRIGRESVVPGAPAASRIGLAIETAAELERSV